MMIAIDGAGGITGAFTHLLAGLGTKAIDEEAMTVARHCLLDWIGVSLAARHEPLVDILVETAREEGGGGGLPLPGRPETLPLTQAVTVIGAMSHALDYDDVHLAMQGHPGVAVIPAAWALALAEGRDGAALIRAIVGGFEIACRVGLLVGPSHYARGWHATGTVGTFGAMAASALLLGLDEDRIAHGFGIAGTQAAGLKAVFGTMSKPLHAGRAAANGLTAARLAARGFTSHPDILGAAQGFGDTQSDGLNAEAALAPAPGFMIRDTLFKYHAACYLTHSAIEAVHSLGRIHPDAVRRVVVRVDPGHLKVCNIPAPTTGLEMKFSLRMTAALALAGEDTAREALFADATAARPDLVRLRDAVTVEPRAAPSSTLSEVEVELADGAIRRAAFDVGVPAADLDRQWQRLSAKFLGLARPVLGEDRSREVLGRVQRLDARTDLAALAGLLAAS
ncbi:MmgE/PrpD family protein (plasmid) [Tistrella mobilis]|uniref:MmgE/PrpD family protein n=1 Tax=Tistrella mobilis TaxID=171437 RepID=UPI003558D845